MTNKRGLKRRRLLRKLLKKLTVNNPLNKRLNFGILDKDKISQGFSCLRETPKNYILKLDLQSILKDRIKNGYIDNYPYYKGRHNRLNFVIGNFKLCLRFVILHEYGHAIYRDLYKSNFSNTKSELFADDYAINRLKELNLLKEDKPKHIEDWSCD
jgi:hypothetical protein